MDEVLRANSKVKTMAVGAKIPVGYFKLEFRVTQNIISYSDGTEFLNNVWREIRMTRHGSVVSFPLGSREVPSSKLPPATCLGKRDICLLIIITARDKSCSD